MFGNLTLSRTTNTFKCIRIPRRNFNAYGPHENPYKNTEDLKIPNKLGGIWEHYRVPEVLLKEEFNYPVCVDTLGIRWPGYWFGRKFVHVPEMEPELVVPDLTGFELKPYVSYRTEEVYNTPFTAKELFDKVYADGVTQAYKEKNVDKFEVPPEAIDEARLKALQTGADLFEEHVFEGVRADMKYVVDLD